jgi:hypothetical protein
MTDCINKFYYDPNHYDAVHAANIGNLRHKNLIRQNPDYYLGKEYVEVMEVEPESLGQSNEYPNTRSSLSKTRGK